MIIEVNIFDIIDKITITIKFNFPLLWYLWDTIPFEYNNALKKKSINNDKINSDIINSLKYTLLLNIEIKSIFSSMSDLQISKISLLSSLIAFV